MSIINPFSSHYHACHDFGTLSFWQSAGVVTATLLVALLTFPLLALPAVAVFRTLVQHIHHTSPVTHGTANKLNQTIQRTDSSPLRIDSSLLKTASSPSAVENDGVKASAPFFTSMELMEMNRNLLDLRSRIEQLSNDLNWATDEAIVQIRQQKLALVDEHTKLTLVKIQYVKANFADNPVYALAIPQRLPRGTQLFTSGSKEKIDGLKKKGIVFNENRPATGLGAISNQRVWGVNEIGNRGIYFCKDELAYLSEELPASLACELICDVDGISLPPISTLQRAFDFPDDQIDNAFRQLQMEYPFIQHDGTYPANTEIVFLHNEGRLRLNHEVAIGANGNAILHKPKGEIHPSWQ